MPESQKNPTVYRPKPSQMRYRNSFPAAIPSGFLVVHRSPDRAHACPTTPCRTPLNRRPACWPIPIARVASAVSADVVIRELISTPGRSLVAGAQMDKSSFGRNQLVRAKRNLTVYVCGGKAQPWNSGFKIQ
jgi:hypothetical protein